MKSQITRTACSNTQQRLSKTTFLAFLTEGEKPRTYFESIPENNWSIISFNPITREVCVLLESDNGNRTLSITLPNLSF